MMKKIKQLPKEIMARTTVRRLTISIFGTVLLTGLVNFGLLWYLKNYPQNEGYSRIEDKWQLMLNLSEPVDVLILGDSSCHQGVDPSIIEAELDVEALNLCTIADALVLNSAWMVDKYIQKYSAPKAVILVYVYDVWYRDLNWNVISQIPLSWGFWHKLEPEIEISFAEQGNLFLDRYVPLYSKDQSIKHIFANPDDWFQQESRDEIEEFNTASKANPEYVEENTEAHFRFVEENQFNLSKSNRLALEKIISLANKYEFEVYLVNSPLYEGLYKNDDFRNYLADVQTTLDRYEKQNDRVHYLFRKPRKFSRNEMENADHVIESAAEIFSHELASEIEKIRETRETEEGK
ncbi:hypothetical protein [Oscillatoria salina]|uniref:hypothetical protein n=1 Tax=Oscillatoria salina TaxID=331517 RepID=UPI0013B68F99|nr:hypothetical protein [Oscillatoria salina]MBZ8182073.1 hypothetical protein [Oscillatoria salina IIICB1]NET87270.1 hypothetical protein [Kamptonema sp. SIO1D9]